MQKIIPMLILFLLCFTTNAQNRKDTHNNLFTNNDIFFSQTIVLPNSTQDSIDIIFCYSFIYDGLIFQKTTNNKFFATPALEALFKDKDGITRKRLITNDTIYTDSFSNTTSRTKYYSNYVRFTIPTNQYKVTTTLNNGKIPSQTQLSNYINQSLPFFLNPYEMPVSTSDNNTLYTPFLANNSIPFSAPAFSFFLPITNTLNEHYTFEITRNNEKTGERNLLNWNNFTTASGNCEVINYNFNIEQISNNTIIKIADKMHRSDNDSLKLLKFTTSLANFTPEKYTVAIRNESDSTSNKTFEFEVSWNDIPRTLMNPAFAAECMYLILDDNEYKKLKDGNKLDVFSNIINYWKQRDPTPTTEYNEAMAEYFRRVDNAATSYQTLTQKDGIKSDRGKVYILNGKPNAVFSEIKEKKSFEIWIYYELKKRYVFEIVSVGKYQLMKIEDL